MTRQVFLPKFSDKRDITEFVEKLEAFERGDLSADQFRSFRLLRGVYGQRQSDVQMIRIKIPFGQLGAEQLEAIADVTDRAQVDCAVAAIREKFGPILVLVNAAGVEGFRDSRR